MHGVTSHRCAKQAVVALLVNGDKCWYGTNWCKMPQAVCPRGDLPTGVGYEKCHSICHQNAHAEVEVLIKAGDEARGGTLILFGHDHFCEYCLDMMERYGVIHWEIFGGKHENNESAKMESEVPERAEKVEPGTSGRGDSFEKYSRGDQKRTDNDQGTAGKG